MRAAILGLGEAGTIYARDLAAGGVVVHAFDIRSITAPAGVVMAPDVATAVNGADLVLSLTTAAGAVQAAAAAKPHLADTAVFADLNAASPGQKAEVAACLGDTLFADVALLAPVARSGVRTPALVSGSGAQNYADLLRPFDADLNVMDAPAGAAASRKLLRSIFMKALAASVLESLAAGRAAGCEEWVRDQIIAELDSGGAKLVDRLVSGTYQHARRRLHEVEDTRDYIRQLETPEYMTNATVSWLEAICEGRL